MDAGSAERPEPPRTRREATPAAQGGHGRLTRADGRSRPGGTLDSDQIRLIHFLWLQADLSRETASGGRLVPSSKSRWPSRLYQQRFREVRVRLLVPPEKRLSAVQLEAAADEMFVELSKVVPGDALDESEFERAARALLRIKSLAAGEANPNR